MADALVEHQVEFRLAERRCHLVLHDLHPHTAARDFIPLFHRADAAHVEPDRRIELECPTPCGGLGIAEHDADFLAQLIDENDGGLGPVDVACELPKRLRHQASHEPEMVVAHFTFDLGLRDEGRHGVDDDHVHRARPDQDVGDFQSLLSRIRLRHEEVLDVHTELLGVIDVHGVLRIDKRRHAPRPLRIRGYVERQSRLPAGFGPIDLRDAAAGDPADADCSIEIERSSGNGRHPDARLRTDPHDGALAATLLDLRNRKVESPSAVVRQARAEFG